MIEIVVILGVVCLTQVGLLAYFARLFASQKIQMNELVAHSAMSMNIPVKVVDGEDDSSSKMATELNRQVGEDRESQIRRAYDDMIRRGAMTSDDAKLFEER